MKTFQIIGAMVCLFVAMGFVAVPPAAEAANIGIIWLDMSTPTNGPAIPSAPPPPGGDIPSGSVFVVPGIGNVTVTYSTPANWTERRFQHAPWTSGNIGFAGDTYSWNNYEYVGTHNPTDPPGTSLEAGTITYSFPVQPAGTVFVGINSLGKSATLESSTTVAGNGVFLGDLPVSGFGASAFTLIPTPPGFTVKNSLPHGQPGFFNSTLGVVRIDDSISSLTIQQSQLRGDGIGVNIGFMGEFPVLAVSKTASAPLVVGGNDLTYTFSYANTSAVAASGVVIQETIPQCATYVASSNPSTGGSCSHAAGVVTCNLGNLNAGASGTFTVTVQAVDSPDCPVIDNGNYSIEATGVTPTPGPLVTTPIVDPDTVISMRKSLKNGTNQPANDFEWWIEGDYTTSVVETFDGPDLANPTSVFAPPTVELVGGNTRFRWANPMANIASGARAEVGFTVMLPRPKSLRTTWTLDGAVTGCVSQITIDTDNANGFDFPVFFRNTAQDLGQFPLCAGDLFVGDAVVEWLASAAPLEELTEGGERSPIRTDVIPGTHLIPSGVSLALSVPRPPAHARFAVIKASVAGNSSLIDASIDHFQFALPPPQVPAASVWGVVALIGLVAWLGASLAARRRREWASQMVRRP